MYNNSSSISKLNPFSKWMEKSSYVLYLRFMGGLFNCMYVAYLRFDKIKINKFKPKRPISYGTQLKLRLSLIKDMFYT